jgi:hypothetical protein
MIKTWQQRCEEHPDHNGIVTNRMIQARMQEEIDDLRAAIEQTQEPVAWVTGWHDGHCVIRAADPAAILPIGIALYTAPRQWQGLTGDEIWACNVAPAGHHVECHICVEHQNVLDFAEAIEVKLKEKNS